MGSRLQSYVWARSLTHGPMIFGVEIYLFADLMLCWGKYTLFADLMPVSGLTSCNQYRLVPPGQHWVLSVICGQLGVTPKIRGGG